MASDETTLGFVHFDKSSIGNHQTEMLVSAARINRLARNRYVKIQNPDGDANAGRAFLGRLVEGPFYYPEELGRDSAIAQTAVLHGDEFPASPTYFAVGGVEILGELVAGELIGANTRPAPRARVSDVAASELEKLLRIRGDVLLGNVAGYDTLRLYLDSSAKDVLPRNLGIFGTVGSGKTNTAQVIIEEVSKAGWAVVVVDVEGEYTEMDKPAVSNAGGLVKYDMKPAGLPDGKFQVFRPCSAESVRRDAIPFTLLTHRIDPFVLSELIDATEAQERALLEIIDAFEKAGAGSPEQEEDLGLKDVLERSTKRQAPYTLKEIIQVAAVWLNDGELRVRGATTSTRAKPHSSTLMALMGKLGRLNRGNAFDREGTEALDVSTLIAPSLVSVIDVSFASDRLKNLVIADALRVLFFGKLKDEKLPPVMVMIEEAHTFVSYEKKERMQETLEMLREIARRGRKRWLGLTFISQQPAHLPTDVFELCNTRIVHNVKSAANLKSLKLTAGDVTEEMWNQVPSLGVGEAIVSSPQYKDPIVVDVRLCATKRQFTA